MSQRRMPGAIEGLRNSRRSLGDGTLGGRSRIATPRGVVSPGAVLVRVAPPSGVVQDQQRPASIRTFQTETLDIPADTGWHPVVFTDTLPDAGERGLVDSDPATGTWVVDQAGTYIVRLVVEGDGFSGARLRLLVNDVAVKGPDNEIGWVFDGARIDVDETVLCEVGDVVRWEMSYGAAA